MTTIKKTVTFLQTRNVSCECYIKFNYLRHIHDTNLAVEPFCTTLCSRILVLYRPIRDSILSAKCVHRLGVFKVNVKIRTHNRLRYINYIEHSEWIATIYKGNWRTDSTTDQPYYLDTPLSVRFLLLYSMVNQQQTHALWTY